MKLNLLLPRMVVGDVAIAADDDHTYAVHVVQTRDHTSCYALLVDDHYTWLTWCIGDADKRVIEKRVPHLDWTLRASGSNLAMWDNDEIPDTAVYSGIRWIFDKSPHTACARTAILIPRTRAHDVTYYQNACVQVTHHRLKDRLPSNVIFSVGEIMGIRKRTAFTYGYVRLDAIDEIEQGDIDETLAQACGYPNVATCQRAWERDFKIAYRVARPLFVYRFTAVSELIEGVELVEPALPTIKSIPRQLRLLPLASGVQIHV